MPIRRRRLRTLVTVSDEVDRDRIEAVVKERRSQACLAQIPQIEAKKITSGRSEPDVSCPPGGVPLRGFLVTNHFDQHVSRPWSVEFTKEKRLPCPEKEGAVVNQNVQGSAEERGLMWAAEFPLRVPVALGKRDDAVEGR